MIKYLVRLDDACPTMDAHKWMKIENILDMYHVKPMVGIIPANADPNIKIEKADADFWCKALIWQKKGWAIALHGFDHCYISKKSGINPLWNRSEFAGVPLVVQKEKICKGYETLSSKGLNVKYFFAPSHTYDYNTLEALKNCSPIRIVSDTIAFRPYKQGEFVFVPQQFGHFMTPKLSGIWTFCFHPNTMTDEQIRMFADFIEKHANKFTSFTDLHLEKVERKKGILDRCFSWLYFLMRRVNTKKN